MSGVIVVGVDASASARKAAEVALGLAESLGAVVRDGVSDLGRQLPSGLALDLQDQFAGAVSA